jgi:4-hydroxybenzoyl-CoA thioesterase
VGTHHHPIEIRFGACDPVGIVYFPRFFDWFHEAMESWFGDTLGYPYAEVLRRHGFPAVHTTCDYRVPCHFGERVTVNLTVGEVGRTSLRLNYRVVGPKDDLRAEGHTIVACIGTDPTLEDHLKPVRIPDDIRAAIQAFIAG